MTIYDDLPTTSMSVRGGTSDIFRQPMGNTQERSKWNGTYGNGYDDVHYNKFGRRKSSSEVEDVDAGTVLTPTRPPPNTHRTTFERTFPTFHPPVLLIFVLFLMSVWRADGARPRNPLDPMAARARAEAEIEADLRREFVRNSAIGREDMVYRYPNKQFRPSPAKVQCYSCMSMSYQNHWDRLQHLYVQPKVFTDRCENPSAFENMPTIECGSVCVSLVEANVEGGVFMGFKYIRGCINRILKHDFNLSALRTHRFTQTDVCRNMPRAVLFANPKTSLQVFGEVNLCTCYGDRCNAGSENGGTRPDLRATLRLTSAALLGLLLLQVV